LAAIANGETTVESSTAWPDREVVDLNVTETMTPVVFSVSMDTPLEKVIEKLLALEVRCLFVTDEHGVLVGIISVFDLLRSVAGPAIKNRNVRSRPLKPAVSAFGL
jgi:predicted transcriptional regulator